MGSDDDEVQYFATGPGRRQRRPGPVYDAYADVDLDKPCPGCGVEARSFCRHPNGALRKIPCPTRPSLTTTPTPAMER